MSSTNRPYIYFSNIYNDIESFGSTGHTGSVGPTGPPGSFETCTLRAGIDPTSAPGPIGGLLVTSVQTAPLNYYLPLSVSQPLDIGSSFQDDPNNFITLVAGDQFQINQTAIYNFEIMVPLLSTTAISTAVVQLIRNGDNMFSTPPLCSSFQPVDITLIPTPIGGLYPFGCVCASSSYASLTSGDVLSAAFFIDSGTVEIPLTANISISIAQSSGPIGPTGATGPSFVLAAMLPATLGGAYGQQDIGASPNNNNCLGYQVNPSVSSISIYNDETAAAQGVFNKDSSISIINNSTPDPASLLVDSVHILNTVGFVNPPTTAAGSVLIGSNCKWDTQVNSDNCIAIGTAASTQTIDLNAGACAISNGRTAETLVANEFCLSDYDQFRLRTLPVGSGNLVMYDPATSYLYNSGTGTIGPMQPTVLGTAFGDASSTTKLQLGYNVNPAQTAGIDIYNSSSAAAQTLYNDFVEPVYISHNSQANGYSPAQIAIHNSVSLTESLTGVTVIHGSPILPNQVTDAVLLGNGQGMDLTNSTVNPMGIIGYGGNVIELSDNGTVIHNGFAAAGHTVGIRELYLGNYDAWYMDVALPVTTLSTNNDILVHNRVTGEISRMKLGDIDATLTETDFVVTYNTTSGIYSQNSTMCRVFKAQLTTDVVGQATQSLASLSLSVTPRAVATVVDASVIIPYTVQINAISSANVTVQVFSAGVPAGAGILVDLLVYF